MIFAAKDVNLSHLGTVIARYEPKQIVTEVIQVTPENIGALCLEFESDLNYVNNIHPFFEIVAIRSTSEGAPALDRYMQIRVGDWIVPLRGEIHLFRDQHFINTFELDTTDYDAGEIERNLTEETPGGFGIASGEVTGPEGTQVIPVDHPELEALREKLQTPSPEPRS